ncbi:MAG: hypothetical protein J0I12_12490 [Candidatus Eremiobacteraeota bacterium]|nr:hypothetical protein [Candidatus Eremiobacteraeota bacterium]
MRKLFWLLLALSLTTLGSARPRSIIVVVPLPQANFPPKWTQTIHVSLADDESDVSDHRYYKAGPKEFRATLKGRIPNEKLEIELMCLSKGEKHISIFRQFVTIKKETKSVKLDRLRFVETLNQ